MTLLGGLYVARMIVALIDPELAARPLNEASAFNTGVLLVYMVVGLVLNLVLAYMVVNRLVRRLQHLSQRDALTGLLNRRALQPMLAREASRLRRYGETYALVMVDIDHFKAVNDSHGHAVGDAVLVSVAELLRAPRAKSTGGARGRRGVLPAASAHRPRRRDAGGAPHARGRTRRTLARTRSHADDQRRRGDGV